MPVDRPTSLRELDVERYLSDPALRQAYVTPMFDLIAPRYDQFTRVFSFGMDRGWKADLVAMASRAIVRDAVVADVATGTGDLAYALAKVRPDLDVAAVDVSTQMLTLARMRRAEHAEARVAVSGGDLSALPFAAGSLDAVTAGYALRNTPDWRASVAELARVIRPGGQLFTLDFYLPSLVVWRQAFLGWLWAAGRAVGWWWHREPMAYGYIAHSIAHFTTAREFAAALERSGFEVVAIHQRLGGGIALHHARRR
jgi:demethylmenaquinone methyltransferase / 2-methoxy-6-polyprenyl-1,4-benzoquinol methylase